jgi:hypothetical protein
MGYQGWGRRVFGFAFAVTAALLPAAWAGAEGFYPVGGLYTNRISAASIDLPDRFLVVSDDTVERYYPDSRSFGLVAYLPASHGSGLTATVLDDGRVLIVGGSVWGSPVASADIYDPSTGMVASVGALQVARTDHTATLLRDGRVLVAGGSVYGHYTSALATAEIFDPATNAFSPTGDMTSARQGATATLLPDGRVLVAGGYDAGGLAVSSADLFDASLDAFVASPGSMGAARASHTATALADGRVLVVGGHSGFPGPSLASAEIYDPTSSTFAPAGDMAFPRGAHTATLLADGRVFVAGGFTAFPFTGETLSSAELWDPTGAFARVAHGMRDARGRHVATALADGEVLVAGGMGQCCGGLYSAEVYSPTFEDTEPPVIYNVQDVTVAASQYDNNGTYVYYYPWATDDVDASPIVTCQPPSGSYLPVGTTTVTCSATDSWGNTGTATFAVTVLEALRVTFTIDAFGSVDKGTGVAVVSGTMSCNRPASAGVNGQLTQVVANRATLVGYLSVYGAQCGTAPTAWSAPVTAQNGRFNSGKAGVSASVFANDNYSSVGAGGERTIQLRAKK